MEYYRGAGISDLSLPSARCVKKSDKLCDFGAVPALDTAWALAIASGGKFALLHVLEVANEYSFIARAGCLNQRILPFVPRGRHARLIAQGQAGHLPYRLALSNLQLKGLEPAARQYESR